jgi:hypothetical protein
MANTGGGAEKPMDNDDNERAKGKQVAGASSSMKSGNTSSDTSNSGNTGSSTDAGMKNTTNQSTGGEKSSTNGGSSSVRTGMFTFSLENSRKYLIFFSKVLEVHQFHKAKAIKETLFTVRLCTIAIQPAIHT